MEKLKGWRTIIATWVAYILTALSTAESTVQGLSQIIDTLLANEAAGIVTAVVTIKQLITDAIPSLRGELKK